MNSYHPKLWRCLKRLRESVAAPIAGCVPFLWLSVTVLLCWRQDTPLTLQLWKPDDLAALRFATVDADPDNLTSTWSVHPGALAWLLRKGIADIVTERRASSALAIALYTCMLYTFFRIVSCSRQSLVDDGMCLTDPSVPAGTRQMAILLSVSLALSPVLAASFRQFSEEVLVSTAVVGMLCCTDRVLCRMSYLPIACLMILGCVVGLVHVYGICVLCALFVSFLVTIISRCRTRRATCCMAGVLAAYGIPVVAVFAFDYIAGWERWHEVATHYWAQSVWEGYLGLPFAGLCRDATELTLFVPSVTHILEGIFVLALGWGSLSSCRSVRFKCVASLFMLVSVATAEAAVGIKSVIHEHRGPLYVLVFSAVCHSVIVMPRMIRTAITFVIVSAIAVPGIVCRVVDSGVSSGMGTLRHVTDSIRQKPRSTPIVIAGSRLFLLLCEEDPRVLSRITSVYVPTGDTPERSPGRHLVPRALLRNQCPLQSGEFSSCMYVQITGSQMIRCSLQGWNVRRWSRHPHKMLAVEEVFVAELDRKDQ